MLLDALIKKNLLASHLLMLIMVQNVSYVDFSLFFVLLRDLNDNKPKTNTHTTHTNTHTILEVSITKIKFTYTPKKRKKKKKLYLIYLA